MALLRRRHSGFTIVELAVTLIIISAALIILPRVEAWYQLKGYAQEVARQTVAVSAQFARYQQANYNSLIGSATWPVVVTTAQVAAANYPIPTQTNTYGQSYELLLVKDAQGGLQGINCAVGGQQLSSNQVRSIAKEIDHFGGAGGFVDIATTPAEPGLGFLVGGNGLRLPVTTYGAAMVGQGHFCDALYFSTSVASPGVQDTALQRINVPGDPQANQMDTTLDLNNNAIVNGSTISTQYLGAKGYSPNSGYPTGWGGGIHSLDVYGEGTVGVGKGGTLMAYMTNTGAMYGQNLSLTGSATVGSWFASNGSGGLSWNAYGGQIYMTDNQWVRINAGAGLYVPGQVQAGTVVSDGRLTAQEFIQLNGLAAVGSGCSPEGIAARDSGGAGWMQCQGGTWKLMQGLTGEVIEVSSGSSCAPSGPPVAATCPATYVVSGGWAALNGYYPSGSNNTNRPDAEGVTGNGYYVQAGSSPGGSCFAAYAICVR